MVSETEIEAEIPLKNDLFKFAEFRSPFTTSLNVKQTEKKFKNAFDVHQLPHNVQRNFPFGYRY